MSRAGCCESNFELCGKTRVTTTTASMWSENATGGTDMTLTALANVKGTVCGFRGTKCRNYFLTTSYLLTLAVALFGHLGCVGLFSPIYSM